MKFVLPCLLFLSFPAYADIAVPAGEPPQAEEDVAVQEKPTCKEEEPCEMLQESDGAASRIEIVTPEDVPDGYSEQIYILE